MEAREAHKILWRRIAIFCGKFPKLLGTPIMDNQQPSRVFIFSEGSETIMGTAQAADGIVHPIWQQMVNT